MGHLDLAIGLGVTSGAKLEVCPHLSVKSEPKMTEELSVPIRNHAPWNAMKSHNLFEVEISYVRGIMSGVTRDKVGHFGESIHHHHDGILASLSPLQARNEIQTNIFPRGKWHGQKGVKALGKYMALSHVAN